jgi:hypothetical protein
MRGLLLEYTGALLILASMIYTNGNPIMVGLAYSAALFIADGQSEGFFTPMGVLVQYGLGRISMMNSAKMVATHIAAGLSVLLLYKV